ncbi:RelA/SpoT family protein [Allobaculum mucilyticum]|uniref:RelA/SpoT family protein n=1 Tax=Allobaculum mucilyticum TaxID=2834459 RepID=UPI001E64A6DF|nr:bifunctional (p)ppGpp synthetase/guanosine-3',5'-bis(diphosphate) 3'-pyrophosphohydrolase [Allobaculum mucilyticum]UNT95781.1 bifunctional (p)ppGpp synthetase/guanosine-3',5'-bis(diphosphate) 3'-pyrophosphohydrolase [Allobaculum mucilyticum]
MPDKHSVTMDQCMENIKGYIHRKENIELIEKAWKFAEKAHEGQYRKSGEPYTIHVIQVANILASLHCSPKTIAAGLLHDSLEDCDWVTYDLLEEEFSKEIADLVEAVTKVGKINQEFKDEKEYQASNHRKIFIAMAKDIRVILIKLADRLHNMRTLEFQPEAKQKRIAKETLQVYAPIAHRLGISQVKNELEDLSFKYLDPREYQNIKALVANRESERNEQVQEMITDIETILQTYHIPYRIFGRSKHFYSIHKKMVTKHKRFEEILDLQAIRIVTDSIVHCYEILGYIHATYVPIPGRFKDYIAMPKSNMYQSLHTTVISTASGNTFEIQIRTEEMDSIAEKGVAAHWLYKENKGMDEGLQTKEMEDKLSWFRDFSIITDEESEDPLEYMSTVQKDIFEANVYCFTPRGKVISLPTGATPIDFAYRIHTEVGNHTVGATVNGAIVPLNTPLKTGDVVNIMTNKASAGPSPDWIKIVKSAHARNKIRSFFQKQELKDKKEEVRQGQTILLDEMKEAGLETTPQKLSRRLEPILQSLSFKNVDDLYASIAAKRVPAAVVIERLNTSKPAPDDNEEILKLFSKNERKEKPSDCGIIVPGIDTIKVSLSPCCSPIPGDEVVGYISKGNGVKVHRKDCPNIVRENKRLIPVSWAQDLEDKTYPVHLQIESNDRNYLLSDLVTVFQQNGTSIKAINSMVDSESLIATTKIEITVRNAEMLERLIANLKKVRSVISVNRVIL